MKTEMEWDDKLIKYINHRKWEGDIYPLICKIQELKLNGVKPKPVLAVTPK